MGNCENCGRRVNLQNGRDGLLKGTMLCDKCKPIVDKIYLKYANNPTQSLNDDYARGLYPSLTESGLYHIRVSLNRIGYNEKAKQDKNEELAKEYSLLADEEQARVKSIISKQKEEDFVVYQIEGVRGRSIRVYRDRCVIETAVTAGSVLTGNATDGEKTIFFHDVIGIQFKKPGKTIGYLQLETASNMGNNSNSNMFSENTFTYDGDAALTTIVEEIKEYIIYQVSQFKHK